MLTSLNLTLKNIDDDGAKALAKLLETNTMLQMLNLSYNNVGADGAKALAKVLETNRMLQTLNLNSNQIEDNGAKALAKALETNTTDKIQARMNISLESKIFHRGTDCRIEVYT